MNSKMKNRSVRTWAFTVFILVFVIAVGFLAWLQLDTYEQGIMDVYAVQQDGYVQLVLDQINLIEDESDDAIVNDILATLDASSNKYWTLSRDDALVFIKDVQETNRYKGFTTATYFVSSSAKQFIDALEVNHVVHSTIELNDTPYVASGVRFEYGSQQYSICLLTTSSIILDHNSYLSAKINLFILYLIILAAMFVGGLMLAIIAQRRYSQNTALTNENLHLREQIEKLTELFTRQELYDTKYMAFNEAALDMLIEKLEKREVWPLTYIVVQCRSEEYRNRFLLDTQALCGVKFIRALAKDTYVLMFNVNSVESSTNLVRSSAVNTDSKIVGSLVFPSRTSIPLREALINYNKSIMPDGNGEELLGSQSKLKENLGIGDENVKNAAEKNDADGDSSIIKKD